MWELLTLPFLRSTLLKTSLYVGRDDAEEGLPLWKSSSVSFSGVY
jgi:hypothetical protein